MAAPCPRISAIVLLPSVCANAAPTLLLWGRDDRTITLDGSQIMLKHIRNVQLHVFGNCGHWVQLECQRDFERLVIDFLAERS